MNKAVKKSILGVCLAVSLGFSVSASADTTEEQVAQKVEQLAAECTASGAKSDYEIAKWFHDWLINNADYDLTLSKFGPEGVLLEGAGVCQSYSTAYQALLNRMGIENQIIEAPEMDHAWNIAKIEGTWTHIDCTWDDPVPGGLERSSYFGLGDMEMMWDHQWDYSKYPKCSAINTAAATKPYQLQTPRAGIDFTLVDAAGKVWSRKDITSGNVLLVFGNSTCLNTMNFLATLSTFHNILEEAGVHIFVVMPNRDEAVFLSREKNLPFPCTYEADGGYESIAFFQKVLTGNTLTYPLLVLQNPGGYVHYFSEGSVDEPQRMLATVMQQLPSTGTIPDAAPLYFYTDASSLESCIQQAVGKRLKEVKLCSKDGTEAGQSAVELAQQLIKKNGAAWTSVTTGGTGMVFTLAYTGMGPASPEKPHEHQWGAWKTVSKATVASPAKQKRTCKTCGKAAVRSSGKKLKPTMKLNVSSLPLKIKQSYSGIKVTGLAKGDKVVSWKSSNPKLVKVSQKGKVTAQNKTGRATVTVTLKSGLKKQIRITVQKGAVKTKKISGVPKTLKLKKGQRKTLKPVLTPRTSKERIRYSSSNRRVATVSAKGQLYAKKTGSAKITVKSGKKKVTLKVSVRKK